MKKQILILYNRAQASTVEQLQSLLFNADYSVICSLQTSESVRSLLYSIGPDTAQLVLTLNGFGFEKPEEDGGVAYNATPVNVLCMFTQPAKPFLDRLRPRINYTISFLVQSEDDVELFHRELPHIYNIQHLSKISDLPDYLDSLDWRF